MTTTLDARELYRRASAEFTARVHRVGDRWSAPTPCADWDVRTLVRHLVEEELWAPPLLGGATIGRQGVDQVVAAIEGRPVQREIQTDLVAITQADMDANSQYFYRTAC